MKTKIAGLSAAALLAASLSTPASAAFIDGALSFSGSLAASSLGIIVDDITVFDLVDPGQAGGGTGDFAAVGGNATVNDFDTTAPGGVIYSVGGFTFTLTTVANITTTPHFCVGSLCQDSQSFSIAGTVTGAGFDPSEFVGNFTAQGVCTGTANPDTCSSNKSASWSSSVIATGRPSDTPVPATLALIGLGLAGLGWTRRAKA